MPVSLTGFAASNSAENEWCANAAPVMSRPATIKAATVRTFIVQSSKTTRGNERPCGDYGRLRPVVLTEINRQIFAADPAQIPGARPRLRVSAGVVNRDLVAQRVVVGTRETLDECELVRMRQAAVREPEVLVETGGT